jgi:tRNA uridine 5-carboxymethylaminomethyl modification enzyme
VVRFGDKDRHQVFIEPEGRGSVEVYPNGISTSLPLDVQVEFIHTIQGLERAKIIRPGYGIEHGLIDARELDHTLESEKVGGLYFAGQVNGTTGYEEAAAQGLIAGINAALKIKKKKPFLLKRSQAFAAVLIDDLTTKGTDEPYRMFTSRCEFRLSVREGNADTRLTPLGYKLGLVSEIDYQRMLEKKAKIEAQIKKLNSTWINFDHKRIKLADYLKRPRISYADIQKHLGEKEKETSVKNEVEIEIKYQGFLQREKIWLRELKNLDKIKMPKIDYRKISSLSKEVVYKLEKFKPTTLGQALGISGITPAAILSIYGFIKKKTKSS